jgi:hypothetical protein
MYGVRVAVHSDPVDEWHPMVIGAAAAADEYQPLADEVAVDLRRAYDLNVCFRHRAPRRPGH